MDLKRARTFALASMLLGLVPLPFLALLCLLSGFAPAALGLSFFALWIVLATKEVGRRRPVAVAGFAFFTLPAVVGLAWALPRIRLDELSGVLAFVMVPGLLLIPAALVGATVCAALVPSGTIPPDAQPVAAPIVVGQVVMVRARDGRDLLARVAAMQGGHAYVEFREGIGEWIPMLHVRLPTPT